MRQSTTNSAIGESSGIDLRSEQERLISRLNEGGIDTQRVVDVIDGEKRSIDHTLRRPNTVLGNYGVYAGRGKNGERETGSIWLLQFDVDAYECGRNQLRLLDILPETFEVESPHTRSNAGGHRYYAFEGDAAGFIEDVTDGTTNPETVWGSIRVENQLVVGPGSQIEKGENGCDKEWCDGCDDPNGGYYRIAEDREIATIAEDDLRLIVETDWIGRESTTTVDEADTPVVDAEESEDREIDVRALKQRVSELPYEEIEDGFYPGGRLEVAFNSKSGQKIRDLWLGNYRQAGFGRDRSKAEAALVNHLGWYMKSNWSMVSMLVDLACQCHPTTDWGDPRKWAERGSDYHESLSAYSQHEGYQYDGGGPNWDLEGEERPEVGYPTLRQIRSVVGALEIASKTEIMEYEGDDASNWDEITRGSKQVNRGINELEERGLIYWYRNGRTVDYYTSPLISEDRLDEKGIEQREIWEDYSKSQ